LRRYVGRSLDLSPDGRLITVAIARDDGDPSSMSPKSTWVGDVVRGTLSLLADEPTMPLGWSPDGRHVTLLNAKGGLSRKAVDGSGIEEELAAPGIFGNQGTWTPDGRRLLVPPSRLFTWPSPAAVGRELPTIDKTFDLQRNAPAGIGFAASFSPDGHWVAYHSVDAGRTEVYARAFRGPGPVVRISVNGGQDPRWKGNENAFPPWQLNVALNWMREMRQKLD
jgi:hypothetical protein